MKINLSARQWGVFFTVASAAVIGAVFYSQYVLKMPPCHLCLMQRIPFYVAFVLGLLTIVFADAPRIRTTLLALLAVTFLTGAGLALFHFGVEEKWWTYASGCSSGQTAFQPGASVEEMMAALKKAPTVRCDQAITFLFGMSMAFYNILTSAVLSIAAIYAVITRNAIRG